MPGWARMLFPSHLSFISFIHCDKGSTPDDLERAVLNLLTSTPSPGGWQRVKYDKSPPPPTRDEPAVLIKVNLVHCNLIAPSHNDITYRAVYFCGVFYTALSAKEAVSQEVLSAVYDSALRLVSVSVPRVKAALKILIFSATKFQNAGTPPLQPSHADLDKVLFQALVEKFERTFGFPYDGKNTAPKSRVGTTIYNGRVGFDSKTHDKEAAKEATEAIMR